MRPRFVAGVVFLLPVAATAAVHPEEHHGVPWGILVFSTINLLVFIWILRRFAWAGVMSWVRDRRTAVLKSLEDAAREKEEAERLKAEWQDRVANLEQELADMRTRARKEIEKERDDILAAARRTAQTIREDARRVAEQELREARARLRQEVARQAFAIACDLSAQRVTPADHERFVQEFVDRVTQ